MKIPCPVRQGQGQRYCPPCGSGLKIAINLNNEMYLRVIPEKELGSKCLIEYTVFFCWQLHFSVEAQVAYILGKNEAESCYVVA